MNQNSSPLDLSQVKLSAEQQILAEQVARCQHQWWVKQRLAQGWQFGPEMDLATQTHPRLQTYDELPEAMRQDLRSQAIVFLQTLLALGQAIAPGRGPSSDLVQPASVEQQILSHLQLASPDLDLPTLLALHRETIRLQPRTPDVYLAVGDAILQLGEPLIAYDILAEGLQHWPTNVPLQQRLALALARSGATHSAQTWLLKLVEQGDQDGETLGLLARTHKDLWLQSAEPEVAQYHLQQAVQRYQEAHWYYHTVWTGINAATLNLMMGQTDAAQQLARQVRAQCLEQLAERSPATPADPYWLLATIGEASLVLGDWAQAEDYYRQAATVGAGRYGNLSSSCRNATLLVEYLGADVNQVKQWFRIPRIAMFCSQGLTKAAAPPLVISTALERPLGAAIAATLQRLDARLGYASAACGPDLLFLEAIQSLEGKSHIVLPYNREQFVQDAVDIVPGSTWIQRFEQVMAQAAEVVFASELKPQAHDVVDEYSYRLLHGLAKMRAQHLDTELVPIAIYDSTLAPPPDAARAIPSWQPSEAPLELIDLAPLRQQLAIQLPPLARRDGGDESDRSPSGPTPASGDRPAQAPSAAAPLIQFERQIRAMLFADVVQFTRLTEDQYLPFMQDFMGAIAQLSADIQFEPLTRNTWGDAIYYVFPSIRQAGTFALALCDVVQRQNWAERGLPADMNLRIALHAGPVYRSIDPITNRLSYFGAHVNHAARIEPITPPGKVYASQAFAAITCSEGIDEFTCDYVGQMPWAKRYGTFPTYHVRWADPHLPQRRTP